MPRPIRVLQMCYSFDVEVGGGGLTRFATELSKHLNPDLIEVAICSLGYYDSPSSQEMLRSLNQLGIKAFNTTTWIDNQPFKSFYQSFITLKQYLYHKPFDIIHSHSEFTDIIALLLKIQSKVPRIMRTVHYSDHKEWIGKPWRRWIFTNFLIPLFYDLEIGINSRVTKRLTNRLISRIKNKKSERIYNAIDLSRINSDSLDSIRIRKEFNIPFHVPVLGTIGRLAKQKGYSYLLATAKFVFEELPEARLLIIGDGPLLNDLKLQTKNLDINDNVIFTGPRKDIIDLLGCMDVFVSSSLWEGLPTVLLEAMACQVPVVATDIPGTNELIKHNFNGILVPPKQVKNMGTAIIQTIRDKELCNTLTYNAEQTLKDFTFQEIAPKYEHIYQLVIENS